VPPLRVAGLGAPGGPLQVLDSIIMITASLWTRISNRDLGSFDFGDAPELQVVCDSVTSELSGPTRSGRSGRLGLGAGGPNQHGGCFESRIILRLMLLGNRFRRNIQHHDTLICSIATY
jgi:hypothetical protein